MDDRGLTDAESMAVEASIEPELAICDAHHHLWQRPPATFQENKA